MSGKAVLRGMRAERIRTGGSSSLWTVVLPAAVTIPIVITFGIALVAESFARIPGQISVLQVTTSNAAYWVITVTVIFVAVAGADGQAAESRHGVAEHMRLSIPHAWPVLVGRWLFYGALGAVLAAVTLAVVLVGLPVVAPRVYGAVSLTDPVGQRLLWTVPLLAFFAAAAGVGLGALIRSRLGAVGVILLWAYAFEIAAGYLPSGAALQRFMPLLNAVYATGQDSVLTPPWGRDVALAYACSVFTAIFVIANVERTIRK